MVPKTWKVGLSLVAAWMIPASAAAGDGKLAGVRTEARGKPGKLDTVRDEVEGRGSNKGSGGSRRSSGRGSSGDSADAAVSAVGGILELIGAVAEASEDRPRTRVTKVRTVGPEEPHHPPGFLRYPYADNAQGYMTVDRPESENRWFGLSARLDSGFTFGGLYHGGFGVDMQAWRIAIDSEMAAFVEPATPGHGPDAMMLGSSNFRAAIIMAPFVRVRIGIGAQYLLDAPTQDTKRNNALGFDLSADADVFPVQPVVLSFRVARGRLAGLDTTKARGSVGIMIRRFELFADYNLRRLGTVNLHGPGLGLRTWF